MQVNPFITLIEGQKDDMGITPIAFRTNLPPRAIVRDSVTVAAFFEAMRGNLADQHMMLTWSAENEHSYPECHS